MLWMAWVSALVELANADVNKEYGFGSRNAAMAGASVAEGFDPFSTGSNPASLASAQRERVGFGFGLLYMHPRFHSIDGVLVENPTISDKNRVGSVDTEYPDVLGQVLGISFDALPDFYHLSFGLTVFTPLLNLAKLDTGETYRPEYVLYRARFQRPQFQIGSAIRPAEHFSLGLGLELGFSSSTQATLYLKTSGSQPSSLRYTTELKPRARPYWGLLWEQGSGSAGLVVRLPASYDQSLNLDSTAEAISGLAGLDFNFQSRSSFFYDPLTLELGAAVTTPGDLRIQGQLDYEFWKDFRSPSVTIEDSAANKGIRISPGIPPAPQTHNILVPRLGLEWGSKARMRAGYAYRPSIIQGHPEGSSNILDPSVHQISGGMGFQFPQFFGMKVRNRFDLHAALHLMESQEIKKTSAGEIGAPGYQAGGNLVGGGVSLTLEM